MKLMEEDSKATEQEKLAADNTCYWILTRTQREVVTAVLQNGGANISQFEPGDLHKEINQTRVAFLCLAVE
ncbi:hypothetical protein J6590_048268 [Homalodisca vitripennis]|nr:hypothetical protein J6590_048268 [Homalodisca vitripennis]